MATLYPPSVTRLSAPRARTAELHAEANIARPRTCIAILLLADIAALSWGPP